MSGAVGKAMRFIRRMAGAGPGSGPDDSELLERFTAGHNEEAFAELLRRHGPMVLGVCRRVLGNEADAEDVFQATFLVLLRKADAIRRRNSVGSWLHGVAYRIALKAKAQAARRRACEHDRPTCGRPPLDPHLELVWRDLRPVLDEELCRLPEKYRAPLLLCYFEGLSYGEAARQLGWADGTVSGRLARARALLHTRLVRRGVVLSAEALAAAIAADARAAVVRPVLAQATARAAFLCTAGESAAGAVSASVTALTEGVLRGMFVTQLRTAAAIVVTATFAGISTGVFAYHQFNGTVPSADPVGAKQNSNKVAAAVAAPADPSKKADSQDDAAALQRSAKNLHKLALAMHDYLQVTGRLPAAAVFDSDGKPLLSWRVLLLPYIGEKRLFAEFHLDEAWDSPHNRKLLAKMPRRYAPVNGKTRQPFATYYQVFVGKGAAFEGTRGLRVFDFTDGTSNTFLIAEAGEAVPWTKPADLPFAPNAPLPKLGGQFADGFHAALADGSVCLLRKDWNAAEEKAIRVVIGRNDGMVVPKEFEGLVRKPSK